MFWFHCGRCGSLFEASASQETDRLCPTCGADPCPGRAELKAAYFASAEREAEHEEESSSHGKHPARRRKASYFMLKLLAGWTLVLALIIIGARKLFPSVEVEPPAPVAKTASATNAEDAALYQKAGPQCAEIFSYFMAAESPEARNQFVLSPVSTASRMAQFLSVNSMPDIDPASLTLSGSELINIPGGKAFEARWKTSDGKTLDTVFQQENGEWRLDWEHYARYSDHPWALFLAGTGPDEGEFRLLARERLAEERKEEETISLVLYAPRFGHPHEAGFQSPEFLVSRNTRDGKLLDAAFKTVRGGGRILGGKLPSLDPDDMIRVRVKVRRTGPEDERKYEIIEVKACHWLSIDDPGVEPEPPAPKESQEAR
jgi:predicted  nucleic acid-binding Zn-ribbon protein